MEAQLEYLSFNRVGGYYELTSHYIDCHLGCFDIKDSAMSWPISEKMNREIEADIKEVLSAHNEFQRQKIARGEKPDYYPDAPRSNIRCRYQNYP